MTSVFFIIILLVVSGFVAWAGDVLGRVLGKRRVSLFKLRPRRTAILISVITGALITGITIFSMTLMSNSFRRMIFEIDTVLSDLSALETEQAVLITERDQFAEERDTAMMERDRERENLIFTIVSHKEQVSTIMTEIEVMQAGIDSLGADIDALNEERDELTAVKTGLEELVGEREVQLEQVESRLTALASEVSSLTIERDTLTGEVLSLTSQIVDLNGQIVALRDQMQSYISGTIKVYEGQQLTVFGIDARNDGTTIYELMRGVITRIPDTFQDPQTGEYVIADNEIDIPIEAYSDALEDIRALTTDNALVIVYSTENVVEDMAVPVRLEVTRNYKVYSQGTTIYSNVYSELENVTDPYRAALARFFEDASDNIVNERRLIPYTSGESLQMPIDILIELAGDLQRVGLPAEIKIIALMDIYRTDFLLYGEQFEVEITHVIEEEPE